MGRILRWNCPKNLKARVSACQQQFSLTRSRNTGSERNGDHKTQTSDCVRMVHVRRGFYDLAKAKAPIAIEALRRIAALYAIEADIRGKSATERQIARQAKSKPLIVELRVWFEAQLAKLPAADRPPRRSVTR